MLWLGCQYLQFWYGLSMLKKYLQTSYDEEKAETEKTID